MAQKPDQAATGDDSGVIPYTDDPKVFLTAVMNCEAASASMRADAAKALLPFVHQKKGEGGKKDDAADRAKKAGLGRFRAAPAPLKLVR